MKLLNKAILAAKTKTPDKGLDALRNARVFAGLLIDELRSARILILAQSLAYTTVLSIVPIFIIFFSVLGRLAATAEVQGQIFGYMSEYILPDFIGGVFSGLEQLSQDAFKLGALGLPLLMLVGVSMYLKVDHAINIIWKSQTKRKLSKNVMAFLMSVLVGPLLLITLLSLPTYLSTLPYVSALAQNSLLSFLISSVAPFLFTVLAYSALYRYVPMAEVKWRNAFVGGTVGALLLIGDNMLLGSYLKNFANYGVIYGPLSALPVFFLWIYSIWVVTLLGSVISYISQNYSVALIRSSLHNTPAQSELNQGFAIMLCLTDAFEKGEKAPTTAELEKKLGIPSIRLDAILAKLAKSGLVSCVSFQDPEKSRSICFQPGMTTSKIDMLKLQEILHQPIKIQHESAELKDLIETVQVHPAFSSNASLQDVYAQPAQAMKKWQDEFVNTSALKKQE